MMQYQSIGCNYVGYCLLLINNQIQRQLMRGESPALYQTFIHSQEEEHRIPRPSSWQRFKECFLKHVQTCGRIISFGGEVEPTNYQSNLVKNTKYNLFTFVPLVLFNQFKFFYNLFFLLTALTQLFEALRVALFFTFIGPLVMVLSLTMAKEAYDDLKRYRKDIQANSKEYQVLSTDGILKRVKSKDLKVGNIVRIEGGDRVPADMVVLYSNGDQGTLFLKTDQLDGETDWKFRKSIKNIQSGIKTRRGRQNKQDIKQLLNPSLSVIVDAPNAEIYTFTGLCIGHQQIKQKLTLENTMWTSTVLTNGIAYGLVIYVGRETRISMGGSLPRTKVGILDNQINTVSKVLFVILLFLTTTFIFLQNTELNYVPFQFMRMLILLSSIIPVSMRVNLDYAKFFYVYLINNDKNIKGAVARNSNCPEELGRVQYILSDKTGTLTQNDMLLRQISINEDARYANEHNAQILEMMKKYEMVPSERTKNQNDIINILKALALCHNVTPCYNEQNEKEFQASSPDEVAFVKAAESYGLAIQERTQSTITLKLPNSKQYHYQIKYTFPFNSQTKRMGILLKDLKTEEHIFYLKGADTAMKDFISDSSRKAFIEEQCNELSMRGLRTLVFASKVIQKQSFKRWSSRYETAYNRLKSSQLDINEIINELETGVQFLGITAIEDKLQDDLAVTIESLRGAGIKMWMITGDKMQTAECIGRLCGLQKISEQNHKMRQINNVEDFNAHWSQLKQNLDQVLIIDGKTLQFVLDNEQLSKDFYKTSLKLPTVICCRCSPKQKAVLTQGVKGYSKSKSAVLAIGDGGNDVGMIQAADVGIGVIGKQGMQAALAADFSIKQFKDLKILLFWHGRLSYKRSSLLACFVVHRGFIISIIQLIFSFIFYYVSINVFNSWLQLGYSTIFTFWPVFALILDKDIDVKTAQNYPKLYQSLQKDQYLSISNFFVWIWKATYQAGAITILTLVIFVQDTHFEFQTIAFTVLIITEYAMTVTEITKLHFYLIFCVVGSLLCYMATLIILSKDLYVSRFTLKDFGFILLIFAASWGPLFIYKLIRRKFYPNSAELIMKTVKQNFIARDLHGQSSVSSEQRVQSAA